MTTRTHHGPPRALGILLALNIGVFVLWQVMAGSPEGMAFMSENFLVSLESISQGRVWTLVTSAFSHVSLGHLFFNMFALWIFGRDVSIISGGRGFVHLYLAGGIAASVGHVLFLYFTGVSIPALGASGSVMAVAVVFAAIFPSRPLYIYFVLPVPAAVAVGAYILLDLFGAFSARDSSIAHAAHLGGAVYGYAYYRLWVRPRLPPGFKRWIARQY